MNFRDVELLSAYLDGQLNSSDSARIESRLKADRELASVLEDLRAARGVLRKLPSRRAPRNFTLTPKMAGLKAPMPRAYPALRFASVFAAILFFLSYATNFIAPRLAVASAPAYGMGGGGGGGPESFAATQAPAATEAPALAPAATLLPGEGQALTQMQPVAPGTATPSTAEDSTRIMETETQAAKNAGPQEPNNVPQPEVQRGAPLFEIWQWSVGILALLLGLIAWLSRIFSERAFRRKLK